MKYLFLFCLLLVFITGFSQDEEKAATYYYDMGIKKESDPDKNKQRENLKEAFQYYLKSYKLAREGSELQLKAMYKTVYLYNFADIEERPLITQRTIRGLWHLRKLNRKDSFTADYFFRAGLAFTRDYRSDSAIYTFGEARKVYQKLKGDYSVKISNCDHGIGDVYRETLYDYNSAEFYYEKALAVIEKAKKDELNVFLTSKLYSELASVNKSQHDYEKALAYSLRHITFIEKLSPAGYHNNIELAYTSAADIYSEMGSVTDAENLYRKAISLNKKINQNRPDIFLADCYFGLANALHRAEKIEEAIPFYLKGITIFKSVSGLKDVLYIKSYQRLGEAYLSKREMKESRASFYKAIQLLDEFGLQKSGQASELYRLIGNYFVVDQHTDSALVYYQYALVAACDQFKSSNWNDNPTRKEIRLDDFAYEALLAKSTLLSLRYEKTKDIHIAKAAIASFDLAEKLLVDSRAKLDMDNAKWIFFDSNFGLYQQALSLLYQVEETHHDDSLVRKAFYYMESSKSKMLADALNEAEFARPLLTSDSLIQFLDLLRRNLYQLQDELKKQEGKVDKQATIRNSIIDVDRNIQRAENAIAVQYPAYIKTKYRYDIPKLAKIQNFSKNLNASVIEFFWGPDEVFGLAVQGDKVIFKKLGMVNFIQPKINIVRNILSSDRYSYSPEDVDTFEKNALALYELLLAPFDRSIEGVDRLIILPDGPIEQIPFEALISKSVPSSKSFATLHYLIREYTISYAFSSSYLLKQNGEGLSDPLMLAFGFTQGSQFRSGGSSEIKSNQLPGSESELKAILSQFPKGEYLFGEDVTEERFKEKAPYFDLIHLAVHGAGDTEQQYSASLFFRDTTSSKEDGRLHWYELFGLRLKAKLAVISSCESGIGKAYRGEGMLSMASAFAFAGCKNLVMGLWKVEDRVSADIMTEFYGNLRSGDNVDIALTKAKRSYLEQSDNLTANPKLWASLVSYGNEQVIEKDNRLAYWTLFFLLISVTGFIFYKKRKGLLIH